jgi:uncharacterized membrane protein YphA (DoxX/SURF4 family)
MTQMPEATASAGEWTAIRRIGFRFGVLVGALIVFPFPIGTIPKTDGFDEVLRAPLRWGVSWLAQNLLGVADPSSARTGSSDRTFDYVQLLLIAMLATLGTILWSAVDRRRAYPRLATGAWVVLRYYLVAEMLIYGFSKIMKSQFPDLPPGWLYQRVGDSAPMRLLWDFMGYSTPYTVFAGLAEAVGGVLLLWRRTATLGALIVIAVMTNVVVMNFCYDVPVKLHATRLLVIAWVIAWPGMRRLLAVVTGGAVPALSPRVRMSRGRERIRIAVKVALIASIAVTAGRWLSGSFRSSPRNELYGTWTVESFVADGVEHPPLTTDPLRWRTWTANSSFTAIWRMDDQRDGPAEPYWGWYTYEVDAPHHTITLTIGKDRRRETWTYAQPAADRLVIDGVHGGKHLHVTLHREPDGLLMTRGFHWINEVPFNR